MKPEDIQKLLGGYATGTLTAEEQRALFDAALNDQELFDALAKEQPLRDLLRDPAARAHVLAAIDDGPKPWWRRTHRWVLAGATLACCLAVAAGVYLSTIKPAMRPPLMAVMRQPELPPPATPMEPSSPPSQAPLVKNKVLPKQPSAVADSLIRPRANDEAAARPPVLPSPAQAVPQSAPDRALAATRMAGEPGDKPRVPPSPSARSRIHLNAAPASETALRAKDGAAARPPVPSPQASLDSVLPRPAPQFGTSGSIAAPQTKAEAAGGARPPAAAPSPSEAVAVTAGAAALTGNGSASAGFQPTRSVPEGNARALFYGWSPLKSVQLTEAAERGAALRNLGVKWIALRKQPGGLFNEVDPEQIKAGDIIKLRLVPNDNGYLSVREGLRTVVAERLVERLEPFETPELTSEVGKKELVVVLARRSQKMQTANQPTPGLIIRSADLSEHAVYEVATGANMFPLTVKITLNFQ